MREPFKLIVLLCSFVSQVSGLGQVEVVLETINNPLNKLADGSTCKDDTCDIKIKATFTKPAFQTFSSRRMAMQSTLSLPQNGTGALNDGATRFDNPVNITAPADDKLKQFALKIEISDYSHLRKLKIATLDLTENVTTGIIYNRTLEKDYVQMEISFKVICELNYYGDCSVYCVGGDNNQGHYYCNRVTGEKMCLPGWAGDDCLNRICTSDLRITNGRVASTSQNIYIVNDTIEVECDSGFELNSRLLRNVLTCQDNGQWSFTDFTQICIKKCPIITPTSHLTTNTTTLTSPGDVIRISCDPGYYLWHAASPIRTRYLDITCQGGGTWDTALPICRKHCDVFWPIASGTVTPTIAPVSGDIMKVTCDPGYHVSPAQSSGEVECGETGDWSDVTPTCTPSVCEEYPVPLLGDVEYSNETLAVNTTATVSCREGTCLTGSKNTAVCQINMTWSGGVDVTCKLGCSRLTEPGNGSLSFSSVISCKDPGPGSTVSVTCDPGYLPMMMYAGLQCSESGHWRDSRGHTVIQEEDRNIFHCVPTGETEMSANVNDLKTSAIFVASITFLVFLIIVTTYYWTDRIYWKKKTVSPDISCEDPVELVEQCRNVIHTTGIGRLVVKSDVPPVKGDEPMSLKEVYINPQFNFIADDF